MPSGLRPLKSVPTLRSLYTQEQTDLAIHRERCRADRNGQEFSLILFRLPQSIGPSRSAMRVAKTVLSRARATDEIGWFDNETVCAILPDTSAQGAQKFADLVAAGARDSFQVPQVSIYTYPSAWFVQATQPLDAAPQPAHGLEQLLVQPMPRWKRMMDVIGASVGLMILSPLMLLIAAAIRLTSRGPVIFTQRRAGLGGKPFDIYKFRSMCFDAEARKDALRDFSEQDGPAFKLSDDPRVTFIGKWLRKTSLDELPQFWNVIKGDMSLVGPRPLPIDEQNGCQQWQRSRLQVTPGLTCIWQVQGRSEVTFDDWVRMDVNYLRRRTLLQDVKILAQTLPAVLMRKGAR